jgi:hypothetical protein
LRSPVPEPLAPTEEQENGAAAQLPCVPGRLVYVRLALFEMDAPDGVAGLIVASIVTVTERPGSRHETLTVTTCPVAALPEEKAVPPAHVAPWVLEILTDPTVRFALTVSVNTISNAVVELLPVASLVNARV